MKKIITLLLLTVTIGAFSQIHTPVKWDTSVLKISDSEYELIATATIDTTWHLYSQNVPKDGPVPTSFTYKGNSNYLKKGNTKEDKGHTVAEAAFNNMLVTYFEDTAVFKQRIKLKTKSSFTINASVEYMVCNNTQCLPPTEVDLVFLINE